MASESESWDCLLEIFRNKVAYRGFVHQFKKEDWEELRNVLENSKVDMSTLENKEVLTALKSIVTDRLTRINILL